MTDVAMDAKASIKETKEVVSYLIHAFKVGGDILSDKKITLGDAGSLWSLMDGLTDAVTDVDQVPVELKDLDHEEAEELIQLVMTNYSFPSERAKEVVEKALKTLRMNYEFYLLIRG